MPPQKILQANLNHCRASQDVFVQTMAERGCGLGVIAAPYRVPQNHPLVLPAQVMVAGDFNAKSALWGSPVTDRRGRILECWAASLGLVVLNRGGVQTCVRHQGGSVIDLTWATPDLARRVSEWRVTEEIESLSDHLFIEMSLPVTPPEVRARRREANARFPRWALKKLNGDLLKASISTALWVNDPKGQSEDPDEVAGWIGDIMTQACDASMPRSKPFVRKAAY
ncbi:uncharacterized protein [Temnothorax longispinosus]|uniref:uncharacterized protein n=1 Tax=Temnothorax longispinosus TaxID=300112 RepID=UPI003A99B3E5